MSFGSAARGSARRLEDSAPCPCGSGDSFGGCCAPVLAGADAPTAERLMRSRYTAFAVGDAGHLVRSWHPRSRPDHLELDPELQWTGLQILGASGAAEGDETGVVEFRASWRRGSGRAATTGTLHERSRFARVRGRWCYLDGEVA